MTIWRPSFKLPLWVSVPAAAFGTYVMVLGVLTIPQAVKDVLTNLPFLGVPVQWWVFLTIGGFFVFAAIATAQRATPPAEPVETQNPPAETAATMRGLRGRFWPARARGLADTIAPPPIVVAPDPPFDAVNVRMLNDEQFRRAVQFRVRRWLESGADDAHQKMFRLTKYVGAWFGGPIRGGHTVQRLVETKVANPLEERMSELRAFANSGGNAGGAFRLLETWPSLYLDATQHAAEMSRYIEPDDDGINHYRAWVAAHQRLETATRRLVEASELEPVKHRMLSVITEQVREVPWPQAPPANATS